MSRNLKFINAYIDLLDSSPLKLKTEAKETEKAPKNKSILESYITLLKSEPKVEKIEDTIAKYMDVWVTIYDQDPLFLLDSIFLYVRLLKDASPELANPVKHAYLVYRNSFGVEEINANLQNYFLTVFKVVVGFGIKKYYSENEFKGAWFGAIKNSVIPIAQIIDNQKNSIQYTKSTMPELTNTETNKIAGKPKKKIG